MTLRLVICSIIKTRRGDASWTLCTKEACKSQPFYWLMVLQGSWRLSVLIAHFIDEESETQNLSVFSKITPWINKARTQSRYSDQRLVHCNKPAVRSGRSCLLNIRELANARTLLSDFPGFLVINEVPRPLLPHGAGLILGGAVHTAAHRLVECHQNYL